MANTEIERLIYTIGADTKGFEAEVKRLSKETNQTEATVRSAFKEMEAEKKRATLAARKVEEDAQRESQAAWAGWKTYVSSTLIGFARDFTAAMARAPYEILQLDNQARKLGVSIAELRGAALWAGTGVNEVTGAIGSLQLKMAELRNGSVMVQREFSNLAALSGVTMKQFREAAGSSGGWQTVIEALGKIKDPATQAAQAYRFLGSNASEVMRQIQRGGLSGAMEASQRFGLSVSNQDVANIERVTTLMNQLNAMVQGMGNQIMLGFAPVAAELTALFDTVQVDLRSIKDVVTDVTLAIMEWGAFLAAIGSDSKLLNNALDALGAKFEEIGYRFEEILLKAIGRAIQAMQPFKSVMGDLGKSLIEHGNFARGRATSAADRFRMNSGLYEGSVRDDIMDTPIMRQFKEFKERVEARRGDTSDTSTTGAKSGLGLEQSVKKFDAAVGGLKQPIDEWKQSLADFKLYTDRKLFQGEAGQEQRALMAFDMFQKLRSSTGQTSGPMLAGSATAFSREAYSAVAQFRVEQTKGSLEQRLNDSMEIARRQREIQIATGNKIAELLGTLADAATADEGVDI